MLERRPLTTHTFPLHTATEAVLGALPCTRPRGLPALDAFSSLQPPLGCSEERCDAHSQDAEKLLRGVGGGGGMVLQLPCGGPFPPLPLCLIIGTPRRKQGLFWAVISSREVSPFPVSSLYFFFLYFRNTKAIPHTCPFVQKIMPS